MIVKGEVDVLDTAGEASIARLGEREVFGERALLEDTPRTATVRAATPVDVLVMSRGDFRAMVTNFPVLGDHFRDLLRKRMPAKATVPIDDGTAMPLFGSPP
jgi:voltage-gated potassium channel